MVPSTYKTRIPRLDHRGTAVRLVVLDDPLLTQIGARRGPIIRVRRGVRRPRGRNSNGDRLRALDAVERSSDR